MYRGKTRTLTITTFAAAAMLLAACGGAAPTTAPTTAPAAAATTETVVEATATTEATAAATEGGTLPAVDPSTLTGDIIVAGSSTVYPLSEWVAEKFKDEGYAGNITIDSIGTGAGFERFCKKGETDISNASRPIRESEVADCQAIGRTPVEFRVGTDALAIVVNPQNTWVDALTKADLAKIFSGEVKTWQDVNPGWPADQIKLFSPGTDSGTFDYFVEEIYADIEDAAERDAKVVNAPGIQLSEDDNVLVQGVAGDKNAIGYFGFAYYLENQDKLKDVPVEGVKPEAETVSDNSYPLSRPLFIYSDAKIMMDKPQVAAFINFFLTNEDEGNQEVGYFVSPEDAKAASVETWLNATK